MKGGEASQVEPAEVSTTQHVMFWGPQVVLYPHLDEQCQETGGTGQRHEQEPNKRPSLESRILNFNLETCVNVEEL